MVVCKWVPRPVCHRSSPLFVPLQVSDLEISESQESSPFFEWVPHPHPPIIPRDSSHGRRDVSWHFEVINRYFYLKVISEIRRKTNGNFNSYTNTKNLGTHNGKDSWEIGIGNEAGDNPKTIKGTTENNSVNETTDTLQCIKEQVFKKYDNSHSYKKKIPKT